MCGWIRRNREVVCTIFIGSLISIVLVTQPDFFNLYASYSLNEHIFDYAGILLGLILTAYAIIFGLVPSMNIEILKADGFQKIGNTFAAALYVLATVVVISFIIFFAGGEVQEVLIVLQFLLISNVTVLSFLLVRYLRKLLNSSKKTQLRKYC
jgi:hypothetical protein